MTSDPTSDMQATHPKIPTDEIANGNAETRSQPASATDSSELAAFYDGLLRAYGGTQPRQHE